MIIEEYGKICYSLHMKRWIVIIMILILSLELLSGCGKKEEEEVDPHAGQVEVYDGYGYVWMTPIEGVERNTFTEDDFTMQGDTPVYVGDAYTVLKGFDVSEFQHEINWDALKGQNLDFVMIRCGRRGYTEGGLFEDTTFRANMEGAKSLGLKIGVYFYTQATTVAEAIEEANFVLDLIKDYDITMPVAWDWEKVDSDEARAENLDVETLTNCTIAFCDTIKNAGYEPAIYYNRTIGYYRYDLSRLTDYTVWFSLPVTPPDVTYPSFLYKIDMWQYTISATLPGISTEVDLDYMFIPKDNTSK